MGDRQTHQTVTAGAPRGHRGASRDKGRARCDICGMARRRWLLVLAVVLLSQWTAAMAQCRQLHPTGTGGFGAICSASGAGQPAGPGTPGDAERAAGLGCPACHQLPIIAATPASAVEATLRWTALAPPVAPRMGDARPAPAPPYRAHAPPSV